MPTARRLYRLSGAALVEVSRIDGCTNRLGERDLDLARIGDIDEDGTPEIIIPSLTRRELAAIGFKGGRAVVLPAARATDDVRGLISKAHVERDGHRAEKYPRARPCRSASESRSQILELKSRLNCN